MVRVICAMWLAVGPGLNTKAVDSCPLGGGLNLSAALQRAN